MSLDIPLRCKSCDHPLVVHCGNLTCDWLMCADPKCRALYSPSKKRWAGVP